MNSPHWMSNAIVIPRHVSWNPGIDDWFLSRFCAATMRLSFSHPTGLSISALSSPCRECVMWGLDPFVLLFRGLRIWLKCFKINYFGICWGERQMLRLPLLKMKMSCCSVHFMIPLFRCFWCDGWWDRLRFVWCTRCTRSWWFQRKDVVKIFHLDNVATAT